MPFGDLTAFDKVCATHGHRIAAVLVEPIQGEGGAQLAPAGYLKALRERCTRRDWLLMLDEIQTGMGRTGKWFAFQHEGIVPDVMTLAKGLGSSTFGGNPLACRAGCTVIDIIEQQGLVENARVQGQHLLDRLRDVLGDHPSVQEIRGQGLMIGIELQHVIPDLTRIAAEQHGLLINVTRSKVIRLLPPLVLEAAEVEQVVQRLAATFDSVGQRSLKRMA